MKKRTALTAVALALSVSTFAGCGDTDSSADITATTTTAVTSETTPPPAEESSVPEESKTESSEDSVTDTTTTTTTAALDSETESKTQSETTTTAKPADTTTTTKKETAATTTTKKTTTTTSTSKSTTTTTTTTASKPEPSKNRVVLDVKNIKMLPELPRGSEITSAAMVLNYYGIKCDKMDLLKYLPMSSAKVSPYDYFCGNPKETQDSYGCYCTVIVKSVNNYLADKNISGYEVIDIQGKSIDRLYAEIEAGYPVIMWSMVDMQDVSDVVQWSITSGGTVSWIMLYNCVVLVGYDKDKKTLIVNDPISGVIEYPKSKVNAAYRLQYAQAVVIRKK